MRRNTLIPALITCIAVLTAGCEKNGKVQNSTDGKLVLTASFAAPSSTVGKKSWKPDDKVSFMILKGDNAFKEQMMPKTISEDGSTATFEFSSFFPKDAEAYYAYISGEGASSFAGKNGVKVPAVNSATASDFPVTIGKADASGRHVTFSNIYSHLAFTLDKGGISHVILEGRNHEVISRANIVSLSDYSVAADPEGSAGESSIRKDVFGPGTYYIPLFPGITLENGYRITAYATSGREAMVAESGDRLATQPGMVYSAPSFKEYGTFTGYFDAENVACSFGVLSDTHIDAGDGGRCQEKLAAAFSQLKGQALKDDPDGLDGVLIAGDLTNNGANGRAYYASEINMFKSIYEAAFDPMKVPMIYALGNHDPYGWWGQKAGTDVYTEAKAFRQAFGDDKYGWTDKESAMRDTYECRHCIVGSYHIICVTPNTVYPVGYPSAISQWLDKTLAEVTAADPERYVVLLTHPMIYNTVYGSLLGPEWMMGSCSDYWYTKYLSEVLARYPQVMTFSGHLHFPINDPRSIWQGDFTSFGCGSTRYMAIEDGRYENMSSATVMNDANDISSGLLLQFDKSGNARITRMFFSQNVTFDYPWEIKHPCADKSHLQTYNHAALRAKNTAPVLSAPQVRLSGSSVQSRTVSVTFAAGKDDEFVHHYIVSLKKAGTTLSSKRILTDFYKHQWFKDMAGSYTLDMGTYGNGDYTIEIEAYDSWDAHSSISSNFTISAGAAADIADY